MITIIICSKFDVFDHSETLIIFINIYTLIDKYQFFDFYFLKFFISISVNVMLNETNYVKRANILLNEFFVFLFACYNILIAFVNCMQ